MNGQAWTVACVCLVPPLLAAIWLTARGIPTQRLVGAQLVSALSCAMLVAESFACDVPSAISLALTLGLLAIPAGLLFAHFVRHLS